MITQKENPVQWAALMYELTDAQEHLADLIRALDNKSNYSSTELQIDLGHVFAHLNRAWFRHDKTSDLSEDQWDEASQFPNNLRPIG